MLSTSQKVLLFRTVRMYGWIQVAYVCFAVTFAIIFPFLILADAIPIRQGESKIWGYLLVGALWLSVLGFRSFFRRWPRLAVKGEINGTIIIGKNVIGKPFEFDFMNAKELRRNPKIGTVEFVTEEGDTFAFSPDMDFFGFFLDYILEKNQDIRFPEDVEKDFRGDPSFWSYSRREPFNAKYPEGYLDSFLPILNAQKERLIAKGVLEKDVVYGDNEDPLINPDSRLAKIEREFQERMKKIDEDYAAHKARRKNRRSPPSPGDESGQSP